jgi:hypothetical protein
MQVSGLQEQNADDKEQESRQSCDEAMVERDSSCKSGESKQAAGQQDSNLISHKSDLMSARIENDVLKDQTLSSEAYVATAQNEHQDMTQDTEHTTDNGKRSAAFG